MSYATDEPRLPRRPRQPRAHTLSETEFEERRRIQLRDGGLWRIGAATRWLLAGAVSATGALALLAAGTFHGHTLAPPTAQAASANSASQTAGSAGPLAAPAQPPTTSAAPAVVVSGGS
jgi:hypothetical protein